MTEQVGKTRHLLHKIEQENDMPPVSPEIMLLLDTLTKQIQTLAERQEKSQGELQTQINQLFASVKDVELNGSEYVRSYVKEQIKQMNEDIANLQKQLEEVKQAILNKQEESYKSMIRVQASIIFLVLSAVVTVLIKIIFNV